MCKKDHRFSDLAKRYTGSPDANLDWSGLLTLVPEFANACVSTYVELARGIWGHAPPGKLFEIGCSEIGSEAFLGLKTSL